MRFKLWFLAQENLAGPGGGPDAQAADVAALAKADYEKGVGAFQSIGNEPPRPVRTATHGYIDPRFKKSMKKK